MGAASILRDKREIILRIASKHGVHRVRVFGSAPRGEADELSDIDLLVDMPANSTLFDQAALQLELQEVLGCRVDILTERGMKPRIRERVIKEAALL